MNKKYHEYIEPEIMNKMSFKELEYRRALYRFIPKLKEHPDNIKYMTMTPKGSYIHKIYGSSGLLVSIEINREVLLDIYWYYRQFDKRKQKP